MRLCGIPYAPCYDLRSTVHGGITYNDDGFDGMPKHVIGFDCAHAGDFCPAILFHGDETIAFARHSVYRNIAYVKREVMVLLEDVLEVKKYPIIIPYGDMKYDDEYHYVRHGGILVLTGIAFADEEQAVLARLIFIHVRSGGLIPPDRGIIACGA